MVKGILGTTYALATALVWAGNSTIVKSLTIKIETLSLSTLRLCSASIYLIALILLSGRGSDFIHTPLLPLVYVIAAGIVGMTIGDTIYIKSLSFLDVSRAYPIAMCSYPVFTMFLAISLLEESFTWATGLGAFLVVLGIYLMASTGTSSKTNSTSRRISGKGVILALIAAVLWAISPILLKKGVMSMDPFVATAIEIPSAAITLLLFTLSQRRRGTLQLRKYGSCSVALAATAGLLTSIGGVFLVMAIQLIGAGKTALLTSVAPIFILPFSALILKEKLTPYVLAGIFRSVAGVYLIAT